MTMAPEIEDLDETDLETTPPCEMRFGNPERWEPCLNPAAWRVITSCTTGPHRNTKLVCDPCRSWWSLEPWERLICTQHGTDASVVSIEPL